MHAPSTELLSNTVAFTPPFLGVSRDGVPAWVAAYDQVWLGDFEFRPSDSETGPRHEGDRPFPICYTAVELFTGRRIRLWHTEFTDKCPHRTDKKVLFSAYMATAEMLCFIQLGWAPPANIFCLYTMFKWVLGGRGTDGTGAKRSTDDDEKPGYTLIDARQWFDLPYVITKSQKDRMRDEILEGGPYTPERQEAILDYCECDNDTNLFLKLASRVRNPKDILRWGLFQWACAVVEWRGIPIDALNLKRLLSRWDGMKERLVAKLDAGYGCYSGTTFKGELFEAYLKKTGLHAYWPRTKTGRLQLDKDLWDRMCDMHPELSTLWQLRSTLTRLNAMSLPVGTDGRNRFGCRSFGTKTSRNAAFGSQCILLKSCWLRFLVRPKPGMAIATIDWAQQEALIAAVLSNDKRMVADYLAGDFYIGFGVTAGAIPPHVNGYNFAPGTANYDRQRKDVDGGAPVDYSGIRKPYKRCALSVQYQMGVQGLAGALKTTEDIASGLLRQHRTAYRQYWRWQEQLLSDAIEFKEVVARGGWRLDTSEMNRRSASSKCTPKTVGNFPVQCAGAEVMRQATIYACLKGIPVIATLHDSLMVEGPIDQIDEIVRVTIEECMDRASREIFNGHVLRTEKSIIKYPNRYHDEDGEEMWKTVKELAELED
jgi:DNA polymerase I